MRSSAARQRKAADENGGEKAVQVFSPAVSARVRIFFITKPGRPATLRRIGRTQGEDHSIFVWSGRPKAML